MLQYFWLGCFFPFSSPTDTDLNCRIWYHTVAGKIGISIFSFPHGGGGSISQARIDEQWSKCWFFSDCNYTVLPSTTIIVEYITTIKIKSTTTPKGVYKGYQLNGIYNEPL